MQKLCSQDPSGKGNIVFV